MFFPIKIKRLSNPKLVRNQVKLLLLKDQGLPIFSKTSSKSREEMREEIKVPNRTTSNIRSTQTMTGKIIKVIEVLLIQIKAKDMKNLLEINITTETITMHIEVEMQVLNKLIRNKRADKLIRSMRKIWVGSREIIAKVHTTEITSITITQVPTIVEILIGNA